MESEAFFLSSCGHSLHHPCLSTNVSSRLSDAGDTSVTCFQPGCGAPLLDSDIMLLSDPAIVARLHCVRAQRADPSLRFCACGAGVSGGSARAPQLRCGACGADFCWLHGSRHAPGAAACAAFTAEETRDPANAASLEALRGNSKQCPNAACGSWVQRDGGCNSVECTVCRTTFCWLCGQQIAAGEMPVHYQWWNLRSGCRFSQFGAARARTPGQNALLLLATFFYGVMFGVPAALLLLAVVVALPCCCLPIFARDENPLVLFATCVWVRRAAPPPFPPSPHPSLPPFTLFCPPHAIGQQLEQHPRVDARLPCRRRGCHPVCGCRLRVFLRCRGVRAAKVSPAR